MTYHLSPALRVLSDEINAAYPDRDKASDGWIGDAAHRGGVSDHNPDEDGSVNALDVDVDGITLDVVVRAVLADRRTSYVISRGLIAVRDTGFRWARYTGKNGHYQHLHISIRHGRSYEDDRSPWGILAARKPTRPPAPPTPTQEDDTMPFRIRVDTVTNGAHNPSGGTIYLCQFGPPGVAAFRYLSPDQNSDLERAGVELRPVTLPDGRTRDFSEYEKDHMRQSILELRDVWTVA